MTVSPDAQPAFVSATRTAYDTVAVSYAEVLDGLLAESTWDRAMLNAFAELVGPAGPVGDLGCGPGRIAGYLASLGLDVFGVDLSPAMVEVARRAYPGLKFEVGSLLALELADESLAGALAWYSIIHTPPARLPEVFGELARVLVPGGRLLLAFQVGDEVRHIEQGYGHDGLSLDAYRLRPELIEQLAADAGLTIESRLVRAPEPPHEKTPQAYLVARKG
ncbi:class I SAM-dependent DNA methyltransferase [Amycolatopsis saalfeldensis]|uniref:Methyltransferase domain-containing protein n=1 Tax=Amycolatopsis saalfeldensis TaxID=394193 RepID=A0A1H8SUZ5_9PSEU|nr:class I SAM-dependent methyltransferase [Amycolatopsis saalfeldensis]SEO82491.1 Methyltransferase domain-containing protein [Amycolatopsis saalfeldensis]